MPKNRNGKENFVKNEVVVRNGCLLRIFKVGTEERPARQQDIENIQAALQSAYDESGTAVVSHEAVASGIVGTEEAHIYLQLFDRKVITKQELRQKLGFKP